MVKWNLSLRLEPYFKKKLADALCFVFKINFSAIMESSLFCNQSGGMSGAVGWKKTVSIRFWAYWTR